MNSESMNQLMTAGEDEDDFDQLNNETFGELSGSHEDWEHEHEKLAESESVNATFFNLAQSARDGSKDSFGPFNFLKCPPGDYNFLNSPSSFSLSRLSSNTHLLEDEVELAIHESDLVKQLSRLMAENEEDEERFNANTQQLHPSTSAHNGKQTPAPFDLLAMHAASSNRKISPLPPSLPLSSIKSKMTLEELEAFLINDEKKAQASQAPVKLPSPPTKTLQMPSTTSQPPKHKLTPPQQQMLDYLNNQWSNLKQQQQQLVLQMQHVQQQALNVQQRLAASNNPPLNNIQLQQQIVLRHQQQQHFKLQQFLQHNLQQLHQYNLYLQQNYQNVMQIHKSEGKSHQASFPQHHQQMFQQQQMMMMKHQMMPQRPFLPHFPPPQAPVQPCRPRAPNDPFYDGLMEQREKDWLVKIQLLQLHTDNPLIDDYYFTCWSMKRLMHENKKLMQQNLRKHKEQQQQDTVNNGVKSVDEDDDDDDEDDSNNDNEDDDDDDVGRKVANLLISTDDNMESRQYEPMQYQGSLGKLRVTSIYNPRKVLDVHVPVNTDKKQDDKRLKEILHRIEKGFDLLLQAYELHNKLNNVDLDLRDQLEIKRFELIEKLSAELLGNSSHVLQQVLNIRKGVVLVTRWMPLLTKEEEIHEVIKKLVSKLPTLIKKEWCSEVSQRLNKAMAAWVLRSASMGQLLHYCGCLLKACKSNNLHKHISSLLKNKLSFSCVHMLVSRMEHLVAEGGKLEAQEDFSQWKHFIEVLGTCLTEHPDHATPFKQHHHSDVLFKRHLATFLENKEATSQETT